jgi:peroxiredoxin
MIDEGADAPTFELPAVRDGAVEQVALSDYLTDQVVILAFYPGDFNPACDDSSTGLDDLDLFTMQKDVSVLALSGDSVYSHQAFAEEYALHIPLLSDAHGEVADAYGVALDDDTAGYLTRRAVVVVDHRGTVEYTWEASGVRDGPNVDAIRKAVQNVGDDDSAFARYRVGHAHYMEGRRAFTSAMRGYEQKEWMMAKGDFDTAYEEFSEAEAEFNTAARFAEDGTNQTYYERAERKAESLWRAAEWLSDSANAYASGEGGKAQSLRSDAESPLENARAIPDPTPPDEFPPEEDPAEADDDQPVGLGGEEGDVSLEMDVEPEVETDGTGESASPEAADTAAPAEASGATVTDDSEFGVADDSTATGAGDDSTAAVANNGDTEAETTPAGDQVGEDQSDTDPASTDDADESADDIDDEELEEIAAELEQQTEAAKAQEPDDVDDGNVVPSSIDVSDEPESDDDTESAVNAEQSDENDGDDIELDLADPTEGDDEDEKEDEIETGSLDGGGDHGVPDSL